MCAVARPEPYMAAVAAVQHNPILCAFYRCLLAAGKLSLGALVAIMRKMLQVLNCLLAGPTLPLRSNPAASHCSE